jgi:hypothetical protein
MFLQISIEHSSGAAVLCTCIWELLSSSLCQITDYFALSVYGPPQFSGRKTKYYFFLHTNAFVEKLLFFPQNTERKLILAVRYFRASLTFTVLFAYQSRYGEEENGITRKVFCFHIALFIFPSPLTVTRLRLTDVMRPVYLALSQLLDHRNK